MEVLRALKQLSKYQTEEQLNQNESFPICETFNIHQLDL